MLGWVGSVVDGCYYVRKETGGGVVQFDCLVGITVALFRDRRSGGGASRDGQDEQRMRTMGLGFVSAVIGKNKRHLEILRWEKSIETRIML